MTSTSTWYPPTLGTGGFLIDPTNPPFTMNEPTTQAPALSPDLFADLLEQARRAQNPKDVLAELARLAYTAGADAELKECCEWLKKDLDAYELVGLRAVYLDHKLYAARRPKPPSLKKQALAALSRADKDALTNPLTGEVVALRTILSKEQSNTIRRALELIPDA